MDGSFNQSVSRRMQICDGLRELAASRTVSAIEPEDAQRAACLLMMEYLREVVGAPDVAALFAAADGDSGRCGHLIVFLSSPSAL